MSAASPLFSEVVEAPDGDGSFVMVHGQSQSMTYVYDKVYVVGYHQDGCVKLVEFSSIALASKEYENLSGPSAKVLYNRKTRDLISDTGPPSYISDILDRISELPRLDESAPVEIAPFVVAMHTGDRIRMLGFWDLEAGQMAYNSIDSNLAKALSDTTRRQILASSGDAYWVLQLCVPSIVQLYNFVGTVPLHHAPAVVALHRMDHVRIVGFATIADARVFYDAASALWARVLVDRRNSQVVLSYGLQGFVDLCLDRVSSLPPLEEESEVETGRINGPYLIAFHERDKVNIIAFRTEAAARLVYDDLSEEWAKCMVDRRVFKELASYGAGDPVGACKSVISFVVDWSNLANRPVHTARFVVGYLAGESVQLMGFDDEGAAQATYAALESDSKVLKDRRRPMTLNTHGVQVGKLEEAMDALGPLGDSIPLENAAFIVAWHESGTVRMVGLSDLETAKGLYEAVCLSYAKVLVDVPRTITVLSHNLDGSVHEVEAAFNNPNKVDIVVPIHKASAYLAFHQHDKIRIFGFVDIDAARVYYDDFSGQWAKMVVVKEGFQVLAEHGETHYKDLCREALQKL